MSILIQLATRYRGETPNKGRDVNDKIILIYIILTSIHYNINYID